MVPGIEEDVIPTSKPEVNMHLRVIPDEGETVRPTKFIRSHQSLRISGKTQTQTRQRTIEYLMHRRSWIHRTTQKCRRFTI